jgi:hypothetical protein
MATFIREFQDAVQSSELPQPARALLIHMSVWANYGDGVIPACHTRSLTGMTRATGLQRSTVAKYLALLEEAGWLTRHVPRVAESRKGVRTWYELTVGKPELPSRKP